MLHRLTIGHLDAAAGWYAASCVPLKPPEMDVVRRLLEELGEKDADGGATLGGCKVELGNGYLSCLWKGEQDQPEAGRIRPADAAGDRLPDRRHRRLPRDRPRRVGRPERPAQTRPLPPTGRPVDSLSLPGRIIDPRRMDVGMGFRRRDDRARTGIASSIPPARPTVPSATLPVSSVRETGRPDGGGRPAPPDRRRSARPTSPDPARPGSPGGGPHPRPGGPPTAPRPALIPRAAAGRDPGRDR